MSVTISEGVLPPLYTRHHENQPHIVFFDNETDPTRHDVPVPRCAIVTSAINAKSEPLVQSPEDGRKEIQARYDAGALLVGHNVAFDIATAGLDVTDYSRVYDTSIRGVLQGAASGMHSDAAFSLKDLAKPYGFDLAKGEKTTLSFGGITGPEECTFEQLTYSVMDVNATRAVFIGQGGTRRVSPDEQRQTEMSWRIFKMARLGVRVDLDRVRALAAAFAAEMAPLRNDLIAAQVICPRGPKKDPWRDEAVDSKIVRERLRAAGAYRLGGTRKKPSKLLAMDEEALKESGDPSLMILARYLTLQKRMGLITALDTGQGDIIRAWWKPLVASGRVSSGHPNLTQVPRKGGFRECFIARDGNVLVGVDFAALEFRVWAATCQAQLGWSRACQVLNSGEDPHIVVGAEILGMEVEKFRHIYKGAKQATDRGIPLADPEVQAVWDARQAAKAVNYGKIGGMGVDRLAEQIGCDRERAYDILAAWERMFPEAGPYQRWLKRNFEGEGRYRLTLPWSKRERMAYYTEIANYPIQGGGADVAKEALRIVQDAGGPVVMLGHDELVLDVPRGDAHEWGRFVVRAAEEAGRLVYPQVDWGGQKYDIWERWPSK